MKRVLVAIGMGIITCVLIFYLFSFYELTTHFEKWKQESRGQCAGLFAVAIVLPVVITIVWNAEKESEGNEM